MKTNYEQVLLGIKQLRSALLDLAENSLPEERVDEFRNEFTEHAIALDEYLNRLEKQVPDDA